MECGGAYADIRKNVQTKIFLQLIPEWAAK